MNVVRAWLPRPRQSNPPALDVIVAAALGAVDLVYLWSAGGTGAIAGGATAIIGAAFLGLYSATVPASSRSSLRGFGLAAAGTIASSALAPHPGMGALVSVSLPFAVFVLCRVQLSRQLAAELTRARVDELEHAQAEVAARAVAEERARIARDLHDIVAHHVGVIVAQADGAGRAVDRDPAAAREAMRAIGATGREALAEMHRLVGLLRVGNDGGGLAPQPTLDSLPALIEQMRASGLEVAVSTAGAVRTLPGGPDLAAYRVIQEALSNVLKHAHTPAAEVHITYAPDALEVEIVNGGAPVAHPPAGHGIVGMGERVAVYGGKLHAGPRPDGGFEVLATIPTTLS